MHYHCEIVMPPVEDVEAAVNRIMAPFSEQNDCSNDSEYSCASAFWDWFVIGGRWAGAKLQAQYPEDQIKEFYDWLKAEHVTVSGLQWGKQELSPASQIPKVDAKWQEMFPHDPPVPCPLFHHSNDAIGLNGGQTTLPDDVMRLCDVPKPLKCERVIIAGPSFVASTKKWTGEIEPVYMICEDSWNGVNHMKTDWDGKFSSAIESHCKRIEKMNPDYVQACTPKDDWLVVTVDYHS